MNRRRFLALMPVLPAAAKAIVASATVDLADFDRAAYAGGERWAREMIQAYQMRTISRRIVPRPIEPDPRPAAQGRDGQARPMNRVAVILALVLVTSAGCTSTNIPRYRAACLVAAAADIGTTLYALEDKGAKETNPLLGGGSTAAVVAKFVGLVAVSALSAELQAAKARRIERAYPMAAAEIAKQRRGATTTYGACAAVHGAATAWNINQLRK